MSRYKTHLLRGNLFHKLEGYSYSTHKFVHADIHIHQLYTVKYISSMCIPYVLYIILCRLAWVDQKRRQVLYQRYIRATQVLYQLTIKTSGENRQMKQLGIFAAVTIE